MNKKFYYTLCILYTLLLTSIALAAPNTENDEVMQTQSWLSTYYLHPDPSQLIYHIRVLANHGVLQSGEKMKIAAFLIQVFKQNPKKIKLWFASLNDLTDDNKKILLLALWQSNTPESTAYMADLAANKYNRLSLYAKELMTKPIIDLLREIITSPVGLDMLWGSFYGSGDPQYIEKIINLAGFMAPNENVMREENMQRMVTVSAARSTLIANGLQQPAIYRIEEQYLSEAVPSIKITLQQILEVIAKQKAKEQASE